MPDALWISTIVRPPAPGRRVDWLTPDGAHVVIGGQYAGGEMWFLPPPSAVAVGYVPPYWRPADKSRPPHVRVETGSPGGR